MDRIPTTAGIAELDNTADNRAVKLALELAMLGLGDGHNGLNNVADNNIMGSGQTLAQLEELKARKSQNMTECVPVPTSEHVAEIVGRQGKSFPHFL